MKSGRMTSMAVAGLGAIALALGATACGSSDSDSQAAPSGSSGSAKADISAAQAVVDRHKALPAKVGPQTPVGKPIPTGKKLAYINCGLEICNDQGKALAEAAGVLGWSVRQINAKPTPEGTQAAFTEAVRQKPDAVIGLGYAKEAFQRQLAQLKQMKVPVMIGTGTDPSDPDGPGVDLQVLGPDDIAAQTRALADKMIVDVGGEGKIGVAFLTGFPGVKLYAEAFKDEVGENCAKCKIEEIPIAPSSIGKDAATQIANWLRSKPDVGHVYLTYEDLGIGLPTAVKSVGGKMPKTYGQAPTAAGIADLESGVRTAAVGGGGVPEVAWTFVDALARRFTGQSMEPDMRWGDFTIWSKEYNNLPDANLNQVKDYREQFKALWGK